MKFLDYTGLTKVVEWVKSKFVQYDSTAHTLSMGGGGVNLQPKNHVSQQTEKPMTYQISLMLVQH